MKFSRLGLTWGSNNGPVVVKPLYDRNAMKYLFSCRRMHASVDYIFVFFSLIFIPLLMSTVELAHTQRDTFSRRMFFWYACERLRNNREKKKITRKNCVSWSKTEITVVIVVVFWKSPNGSQEINLHTDCVEYCRPMNTIIAFAMIRVLTSGKKKNSRK